MRLLPSLCPGKPIRAMAKARAFTLLMSFDVAYGAGSDLGALCYGVAVFLAEHTKVTLGAGSESNTACAAAFTMDAFFIWDE